MRILILGGNGMIGHKMYQIISKEFADTWVTLRNDLISYKYSKIYDSKKVLDKVNLLDFENLTIKLNQIQPDIVINASGITIRRGVEDYKSKSIILNSALPHFLNEWVCFNNKKLIHLSTDCVFSGEKGNYYEKDPKDSKDLYGLTKSLGEVIDSNCALTLRGSMIGRELENKTELLEWFLLQKNNKIKGFSEVVYSGITTVKMAEIILIILKKFPKLSGLYNISSKPISKFDLLNLCNVYFDVNAIIIADNSYISNKNLISENIFKQLKIEQPNWVTLIEQLVDDSLENNYLYN